MPEGGRRKRCENVGRWGRKDNDSAGLSFLFDLPNGSRKSAVPGCKFLFLLLLRASFLFLSYFRVALPGLGTRDRLVDEKTEDDTFRTPS